MPVTRLALTDFRSYAEALIVPGPGLVVLTGENGAGKTNILEALSLLSPGRGLRGARLSEMARCGGPGGFAVAARLGTAPSAGRLSTPPPPTRSPEEAGAFDIGTGTSAGAPERRVVRINGAAASANALGEWLSLLWLTPAMDRLFQEGAGGRRRFLDRLVLALRPGHAVHAARYEAAMRARNKLLGEPTPDPQWLAALEARMAEHGAAIAAARADTLTRLADRLAAAPAGPFARAGVGLEGWTSVEDDGGALAGALRAGRARDAAAGRTLEGPHRSDLAVTHVDKAMPASACSTGEQKALLLAILLAHADLVADAAGRRPILLLDEVAAHLDPARRAALFARLAATGGQVWMTGTEAGLFAEAPSATLLTVQDGRVLPG